MSRECSECGGDMEFIEILGSVADPSGAIYECKDCGHSETTRNGRGRWWDR